jgi:hypothetical protein
MGWLEDAEHVAAEKVRAELAKPLPVDQYEIGGDDTFDPWALFPCLYGSYSQAFDDMALLVLRNMELARQDRYDEQDWAGEGLAHEMFREMLCNAELCNYGTSPRVCFVNREFGEMLPELIAKWEAFSEVHWGQPAQGTSPRGG